MHQAAASLAECAHSLHLAGRPTEHNGDGYLPKQNSPCDREWILFISIQKSKLLQIT
jgi:hypothetical protein